MIKDFVSLFFPRVCLTCQGALGKGLNEICVNCLQELPKTLNHEVPIPEFEQRFSGIVDYDQVLVYLFFQKRGIVQKLLHELKYNDKPEIGQILGKWYGKELAIAGYDKKFDVVLPIPLHQGRLRVRGYNQSEQFALGLSQSLGLKMLPNGLERVRANETQTRKNREQRWQNVSGVFAVTDLEAVANQRVLLVDDVLTTGSTLVAAAEPLFDARVKNISFAVMAAAK